MYHYNNISIMSRISIVFIVLTFFARFGFSQEKLVQLSTNKQIRTAHNELLKSQRLKNRTIRDTVELPFFDDFSTYSGYPNPNLWCDYDVFVNPFFCSNPPSIGAATLDAIDSSGVVYQHAVYNRPYQADKLTSQPINLKNQGASVYLSFFYQPMGLGDFPEVSDSIALQFYSPVSKEWSTAWTAECYYTEGKVIEKYSYNQSEYEWIPDDFGDEFRQVILPVYNLLFLEKGFQFRFVNYASLTTSSRPDYAGNCDHWNIDYVRLDNNRTINDLTIHDIAFVYPMQSLLKQYEAMPWRHYQNSTDIELRENPVVLFKNNDDKKRLVELLRFEFDDLTGTVESYGVDAGTYNMPVNHTEVFDKSFTYTLNSNSEDSAVIQVRCSISTDDFDPVCNNIIEYKQKFSDYYAYDDGTAENGYGIAGEGTRNAKLAYQFTNYLPVDSLFAIDMFFNHTLEDANRKYFYLTIWDDNDGMPGEIIYSQLGVRPEFEDSLNCFHTYFLDTPMVVPPVYYVGWEQTTDDFLNVGFDANRNAQDKLFFSLGGAWQNSAFEGAVMIRPVFDQNSRKKTATKIVQPEFSEPEIQIYPNPANQQFKISLPYDRHIYNVSINIFNSFGRKVKEIKTGNYNQSIKTENLPAGLYIITITDNKTFNVKKKLMIVH